MVNNDNNNNNINNTNTESNKNKNNKYNFNEKYEDRILIARQKQIDYGKNTQGYKNYIELLNSNPNFMNETNNVKIPCIFQKCSKRSFDGQIKKWRRFLHQFDDNFSSDSDIFNTSSSSEGFNSDSNDLDNENNEHCLLMD
ncbi:hypothetical protein DICPUDRAFT_151672 [Dictyostelium purpureum]|uniref:Histone RNA hairpin-binding protein RNA-binding domain-containing protein n=1 Tax=Dictyostelium purpureum TaxID=5786 RepID=F0ZJG8_DICPU|nr:uncharacterized protein DICPUDRAFT_151672 [Dictyostelium purpureum]EGC35918.1 hypothetical protein DICPUDRAFT_151672 [Dictyostelium purpureum]|eukprot:XP_003287572.1 hypothetical protein DICPUDRAFT_151672 [Dictyostelium purpureum]